MLSTTTQENNMNEYGEFTRRTNAPVEVSIIIPSNHSHIDLIEISLQVANQCHTPAEIIIIDTSNDTGECPKTIKKQCDELGIRLVYHKREQAYPGHARNLGIQLARCQFIGFIDVKTIPKRDWIKQAIDLLQKNPGILGVWGKTTFEALSTFEKLSRDGIFGRLPRRTLPGTIIDRTVLTKVGTFIEWTRAGEDTDWMQRVDLFALNFASPSTATLTYTGLLNKSPVDVGKKWLRNYTASRSLPHLFPQKILTWIIVYPAMVLMAFNWNNLVAGWETGSLFYIPNITKIAAIMPATFYIALRGVVIPFWRGVPLTDIFPLRWINIAVVCLIGDATKVLMFLIPRKRHRNQTRIKLMPDH